LDGHDNFIELHTLQRNEIVTEPCIYARICMCRSVAHEPALLLVSTHLLTSLCRSPSKATMLVLTCSTL